MIAPSLLIGLMAASFQSDEAIQARADASATVAIAAINASCLPIATGSMPIPAADSSSERTAFLAAADFSEGVPQAAQNLLGRAHGALADSVVVGHRQVGRDYVVLAIGGEMESCRVFVASPSIALADSSELDAAAAESGLWRELPPPPDVAREDAVNMRGYLHRAATGERVILFVMTGNRALARNTAILVTTAVPADAELPEGY